SPTASPASPWATATAPSTRATGSRLLRLEAKRRALQEVPLEELRHDPVERVAGAPPAKAVPFAPPHEEPGLGAVLAHGAHDLLRLREGDPRIVLPMGDQERAADPLHVSERRDRREVLAHLRVPLVAVLPPAHAPPVSAGALQEAHEIGHPHHV